MFLINKKNGKNIRIFKCDIYANACVIMCLSVRRVIVLNRHFEAKKKKIKCPAKEKIWRLSSLQTISKTI